MFTNLNGNQVAAIAIDTTGPDPNRSDLIEIAVIPLDYKWDRDRNYPIFSTVMKPIRSGGLLHERPYKSKQAYTRPHVCRIRRATYDHAGTHGIEPMDCAELFEGWFNKLNLKDNKRLMPLSYDWPFVSNHLRKWLGWEAFDRIFDYRFRDLLSDALFENDHQEFNLREVRFYKHDCSYICQRLGYDSVLKMPCAERALHFGLCYNSFQLKRNSWT